MHRGNKKRNLILEIIQKDPGIGFLEIQKNTGFVNGVLSHHLEVLQRRGNIRVKREKRKMWVFPSYYDPNNDNLRIYLRKETCKKILVLLLKNNTSTFSEIRNAIKKSPSTTSLTLKTLIEKKLIRKIHGFPHKYTLENFDITATLVSTIHVSEVDSLKEKFADTFSYY